jgi:hypothetical protein
MLGSFIGLILFIFVFSLEYLDPGMPGPSGHVILGNEALKEIDLAHVSNSYAKPRKPQRKNEISVTMRPCVSKYMSLEKFMVVILSLWL